MSSASSSTTISPRIPPGSKLGHTNLSASNAETETSLRVFLAFLWLRRSWPKLVLNLLKKGFHKNKNLNVSKANLMLVSFCIYLAPRVLMASIWRWSDLVRLNAASTLELVKGDDLDSGTTGAILVVVEQNEKIYIPAKEKI